MAVVKAKGLFDHIKMITGGQDPNYWDTLSEADIKTFSNYMIHRFLTMNPEWVELVSELQPYTETLKPEVLYKLYISLLPSGRYYLKYMKGKNDAKYEQFLIDLIKVDYQCSARDAIEYTEILYATKEGREHIKYICQKYGTEPKMITKLKLKLKK
jgi:hypothetical protein